MLHPFISCLSCFVFLVLSCLVFLYLSFLWGMGWESWVIDKWCVYLLMCAFAAHRKFKQHSFMLCTCVTQSLNTHRCLYMPYETYGSATHPAHHHMMLPPRAPLAPRAPPPVDLAPPWTWMQLSNEHRCCSSS